MTNINKNSIHKIERGIPLPSNRSGKTSWIQLARNMQIEDSVLLENKKELYLMRSAMYTLRYSTTFKQLENDKYRIWRTK
tara:strand:- start:3123 stop:3362 length:240 start_codon:yes stop_codon:yes gene_type:complete